MRFETVGLRVTELDRSRRFYTRALGLRVVRRRDTQSSGGGIWVLLEDPDGIWITVGRRPTRAERL